MNTHAKKETAPTRLRDALRDNGLATVAMVLVVAVAVAGWSASFISLHDFALAHMGFRTSKPAWLVPSTFDGAALGLSLLAFRAAIYGRASVGSLVYVYAFTGLSSWINYVHIDDAAGGKFVSALLPIAAVLVFGKVLKEAREAYERRHGKAVFKVRLGLLVLRWMADRTGTRGAIRAQILAIPMEALIGLGGTALAREANDAIGAAGTTVPEPVPEPYPNADVPADQPRNPGRARRASGKRSGSGPKRAPKRLSDAELMVELERLNAESLAADGKPVSLRKAMTELRVGQPRATTLLDALAAAPVADVRDESESVPEAGSGTRIPLVLGDRIRRDLAAVNGTTAQH